MMRAAASNFWQAGVDGMYTWFMPWPLEDAQRRILSDIGDPDLAKEGNKHYFLRQRPENKDSFVYDAELPVAIPGPDSEKTYEIAFTTSDDPQNERISRMVLKINVSDLVTQDRFEINLNGVSLESEPCRRTARTYDAYTGVWLEFDLNQVRPRRGANTLEFSLRERPDGFGGGISIDDVELIVEYDLFPGRAVEGGRGG